MSAEDHRDPRSSNRTSLKLSVCHVPSDSAIRLFSSRAGGIEAVSGDVVGTGGWAYEMKGDMTERPRVSSASSAIHSGLDGGTGQL